jgi:ABC-2 type transport system ATP-binding protein
MAHVLNVSDLSKSYGRRNVLRGVTFALDAGQVYGVLGPNGSGKSTCLHSIAGVIDRDAGVVEVGGLSIDDVRSRLLYGFAPDDLPLIGALTGREFLQLHDRLRGRNDFDRAVDLLVAFDLERDLDLQIEGYSHGMKRKIQLIAAVMHSPQLLILDEPFRGLDPDAVIVLRQLIDTLVGNGKAVVVATHDMARAERDCDQVIILDRGSVVAHGSPDGLVETFGRGKDLETAFLVITGREGESQLKRQLITDAFERP